MARGGRRQGTPGKAYANRTDLSQDYAPQTATHTAATGGIPTPETPPATGAAGEQMSTPDWVSPDQIPSLDAPTGRPTEPLTAGLPSGPGPGPAGPDMNRADLLAMIPHLPYLNQVTQMTDAPQSVVNWVRYLQSQASQM